MLGSLTPLLALGGLGLVGIYSALFLHYGAKYPKTWWFTFIWFSGGGLLLLQLLFPRTQNLDLAGRYAAVPETSVPALAGLGLRFGVLYLSLLVIVYQLFVRRQLPRRGTALWVAVWLFCLGPIFASVFGSVPDPNYSLFLLPLLLSAFYVMPAPPYRWVVRQFKVLLQLFVLGSLVAAVVAPEWALLLDYDNSAIGLNQRLFGLTDHANTLGPLAVLYLLLEWAQPTRNRGARLLLVAAALAALLLTQSKTAFAVGIVLLYLRVIVALWFSRDRVAGRLATFVTTGFVLLLTYGLYVGLTGLLSASARTSLVTLTGRTELWHISWDTWLQNPLFGYGPQIWNLAFRQGLGPGYLWAGQAHNQFFQSLGEAGLVGVFGLVVLLLTLFTFGFRFAYRTRGASLGLALFVGFRCVTEAALRTYDVNLIMLMLLIPFSILFVLARTQPHAGTAKYLRRSLAQRPVPSSRVGAARGLDVG